MNLNREVVTFRDGTELTVMEANWAVSMRLQELEEQAEKNPLEDVKQQTFNRWIYPKLAACSSGTVPSMQDAFEMPSTELDKWFFAVKRVNLDWFPEPVPATEEGKRKKVKKPIESSPG
jgi:hypothetical protein